MMHADPVIRAAVPSDVPGIFDVRTSVTENALTLAQLADLGITPQAVTDMIRAAPCAWVAVCDGAVVGFSMIDQAEACLFAAFVRPAYEGRGIGSKLVQVAEDALFREHSVAWLETDKTSRAAGFYARIGWTTVCAVGDDDIRMEKHRP